MSRILLLEDDLSLVNGLSFALKKQGFALNTARTLREADAAWADGSYDLLVLDVSLPDGSGFAFCEKVRRTSNVPIMFLTASDEETNIIFPMLLDYQKPDEKYLEELLTVLNLKQRRDHLPSQLSGGQQQRVAIGRALITRPALILADEPTGNLDSQNSSEVIALLKEASKKYEQTIIMITYNRSIAPAAAVSGNADTSSHYAAHAARPGLLKVETSLGIHHAMGAGKNLFLMTGSFALMIVLFLAFSACLDIVHKLLPSVNSHLTPNFSIYSVDDTNSLDPAMSDEIAALPGVKCTYGTMSRTAQPARINGAETTIDLYSYGDAMLDDAKRSVASGDLSKVYGDSGYALAIFSDATRLNVGDSVTVNGQTLEIACVLSEGIGSISGAPVIVCSGETFTRLTGETHYMLLNVLAEKDVSDAAVQKLYALAGDAAVSDNRELQSEVNGSYWVFRLAAYGFLAIISLITVLNIVNSISMGVSARTRQYGAMRAVGMEGRQITRMIAAEAVTYAACGTVTGLVLGLALHHLIYAKIVITHFGGVWKVPVESIALVVLLVAASCVLAVHGPARRIRNMPITATINEL